MEKLYQQYKDRSEWYLVYIREAHPVGDRQAKSNEKSGIEIKQPKTVEERVVAANTCVLELKLSIPAVIDGMDNKAGMDYAAFPDRLYIVDKEGKIAYKGAKDPKGFKPLEMEKALKKLFSN